jgi:hypothetical protein
MLSKVSKLSFARVAQNNGDDDTSLDMNSNTPKRHHYVPKFYLRRFACSDDVNKIIAQPKHPEHVETKRWCDGYFDPEWFDLKIVDKDVRAALKLNVCRRLYQPKPKSSSAKA